MENFFKKSDLASYVYDARRGQTAMPVFSGEHKATILLSVICYITSAGSVYHS